MSEPKNPKNPMYTKIRIKPDPVAAAALRLWKKLDPETWKKDPHKEEKDED